MSETTKKEERGKEEGGKKEEEDGQGNEKEKRLERGKQSLFCQHISPVHWHHPLSLR